MSDTQTTTRGLEFTVGTSGECEVWMLGDMDRGQVIIDWQTGPVSLVGENGWQAPDVLELVAERLRRLNVAPHNGRENSLAITKIEEAIHWLNERTRAREARRVEGTDQP